MSGTLFALRRHSRDTFWTLWIPRGHSVGHPGFGDTLGDTLGDTPRDTPARRARETPLGGGIIIIGCKWLINLVNAAACLKKDGLKDLIQAIRLGAVTMSCLQIRMLSQPCTIAAKVITKYMYIYTHIQKWLLEAINL